MNNENVNQCDCCLGVEGDLFTVGGNTVNRVLFDTSDGLRVCNECYIYDPKDEALDD